MKRQFKTAKARKAHTTRTCRGKVRYRDHDEALASMRALNSGSTRHAPMKTLARAYWCDTCQGFHLTSRAAWRER